MADEQKNQIEHVEVTAVEVNAIEVMERATVDVQIATAHKYPRDINKFIEQAKKMVAVDEETAASCIYRRPVGREDGSEGQKFVEGESIRLAEIVASTFGNLRIGVIISEMTPRYVKAMGFAHDLETNVAVRAEVVESTVTKYGKPYSERMRVVVAKAAQSKARRDAIFSVVPKSLCKPIIQKAKEIISGKQKPLNDRRDAVKLWLSKLSIDAARVFAALGVESLIELGDEELETLTGIRTALKDGEITLDEAFPPLNFEEKAKDTDKNITKEAGSEPVDIKQDDNTAEKPKEEPKKTTAKRTEKTSASKVETPTPASTEKSLYTCNACGHNFDKPKTGGAGRHQVSLCPKCISNDITTNEDAV
jgi:hypothetical protein